MRADYLSVKKLINKSINGINRLIDRNLSVLNYAQIFNIRNIPKFIKNAS